ncbi:hypothetical protein [Microcoleus sp. FACHB-1515]|uniref:hypothetical protein n=1 Tax=Cyanophyceae TaxID=3028117 RepID=UPI0018F01F94|nr:hypothetical protein [Microcoleus sp. FACHB-1515]
MTFFLALITSIAPPTFEGGAAIAQTPPSTDSIDLAPEIIEQSPVLQRWQEEIPDVRQDIQNDPSFRTRIRVGYGDSGEGSVSVGVEDVFLGRSNFTISGDYQGGDRSSYGADLHYYVRPLGSAVNLAPVVGYRHLDETDGVNVGARLMLSLSRSGAADISVTQSWVAPGSSQEAGLTRVVFGYAVSDRLRLSTDYQRQNTPERKDDRWGIALEWLL